MAPKMLRGAPRTLRDSSKMPPRRPKRAPRGQTLSKTNGQPINVAFSPFPFRWPSEASRQLREGPRGPQEKPKRAPRQP
eukprot:3643878-Pyramimonas_sp.AAC.1